MSWFLAIGILNDTSFDFCQITEAKNTYCQENGVNLIKRTYPHYGW